MNRKALYDLTYGVFVLATRSGDKKNACITNTCIQVANDPTRIAIAVINKNYTCELIKESGVFCLTLLNTDCDPDTIARFGYQSGRDVDKFAEFAPPEDRNGAPYLSWMSCGYISGKVVSAQDLGSHTLFIAEVVDAEKTCGGDPLTYAYYQANLKPKPKAAPAEKKIVGWRCKICGYVYEGETLPEDFACPLCGHPADDFEPVYAD